MSSEILALSEAVKLSGVTRKSFYHRIAKGQIRTVRPNGYHLYVYKEDLKDIKPFDNHAPKPSSFRHGKVHTPIYNVWRSMIGRCHRSNHMNYRHYGGRGISVCDQWRKPFKAFYDYVGDPPFEGAELDRKDNDGNYEPGNVRWVTKMQNMNNRRRAK